MEGKLPILLIAIGLVTCVLDFVNNKNEKDLNITPPAVLTIEESLPFFDKHISPSFISDKELLEEFNYLNKTYFDNYITLNSISFTDFSELPDISKEIAYYLKGETHYKKGKGCFILINSRFRENKEELRLTLTHELIHAYIYEKYIENNTSSIEETFYYDQNNNHKGIFKEIENSLIQRGLPLKTNYVHTSDQKFLEKYLARK